MTTYYWVGGSGNWTPTDTTHWSLTSGGAGGAGVPAATDDVVFQNITAGTTITPSQWNAVMCQNMTLVNTTNVWTFNGSIFVSGNITTSGAGTTRWSNIVCCGGTGRTQLISLNQSTSGNTVNMSVGCQLPGVGGATVRLTSTFFGKLTITNNSFDQNSQSLNLQEFYYYGSATQATTCTFTGTITYATGSVFGPFYINIDNTSVVGLNTATILVGQSTTTSNIGGYYINLGGNAVGTISNSGSTDTSTSNLNNFNLQLDNITTIGTLTWVLQQQNSSISSIQKLGIGAFSAATVTIGTLNLTGYSQVKRLWVQSSELFSPTRVKLLVTTINTSGYIDWGKIQYNNSGTLTGTSFGNFGDTVNITFTSSKTVYISSTATNTSTGFATAFATGSATGATGSGNCPLPQDTVICASNSATLNNSLFYLSFGNLIVQTGTTNSVGGGGCYVTYSALFQSGVTTPTAVNFIGSPVAATLTTNGFSGTMSVGMTIPGSTLKLNDTVANLNLTVTVGTLNLNNLSHTLGQFVASAPLNNMTPNTYCNTPAVIDFGTTGALDSPGTSTIFSASGGTLLSFTGTNAFITFSNTTSTTRSFQYGALGAGGLNPNSNLGPLINKTFRQGNITLKVTAGTGTIQSAGSSTFFPSMIFTSGFTGTIGAAGAFAGIFCNGDLIVQGGSFSTPSSEQQAFIMMVGDSGGATLSLNAPIDRTVIITQFMQSSAGGTVTLGSNLTFAPSTSSGNLVVTGSKFSDGGFTISGCNGVISQSSLAGTPSVVPTVITQSSNITVMTAGLKPSAGFFGGSYGQKIVVTGTNSVNPTTGLAAGTYYIGPWYMATSGLFNFQLYGQSPLQTIVFSQATELPPGFYGYEPQVLVYCSTGATTGLTFTQDNLVNRNITFAGGTYQLNTATPWTVSGTNFTTSGSGTTIALNSGGTATFAGGGYSYPVTLNTQTGTTVITGANTFGNLAASGGTTIQLPASTTTSFTSFTLSGVNGSLVNLQSSSSGTQATIYSATTQNTAQYISAQDLNGSGGPWTFLRSVNVSNNTNILFSGGASAGFFNFF
jgi:hypothetical protein